MEEPGPSRFPLVDFSVDDALTVCAAIACPRTNQRACPFTVHPHSIEKAQGKHLMVSLGERFPYRTFLIDNDHFEPDHSMLGKSDLNGLGYKQNDVAFYNGTARKIIGHGIQINVNCNTLSRNEIKEEPVTDDDEDVISRDVYPSLKETSEKASSSKNNNQNFPVSASAFYTSMPHGAENDGSSIQDYGDSSESFSLFETSQDVSEKKIETSSVVTAKQNAHLLSLVSNQDQSVNTNNDSQEIQGKDCQHLAWENVKLSLVENQRKYSIDENANEKNFISQNASLESCNQQESALKYESVTTGRFMSLSACKEFTDSESTELKCNDFLPKIRAIDAALEQAQAPSTPELSSSDLCDMVSKRKVPEQHCDAGTAGSGGPQFDAPISGFINRGSSQSYLVTGSELQGDGRVEGSPPDAPSMGQDGEGIVKGKGLVCMKCGVMSIDMTQYVAHLAIHASLQSLVCSVCNQPFPTKDSLREHEQQHTNQNVHICGLCGEIFPMKTHLRSHEYEHLDEPRPFDCSVCGIRFKNLSYLKIHKAIHQAGKPHHCKICLAVFSKNVALKLHMKSHNKSAGFACPYCQTILESVAEFNRHQHLHTGVKPFKCSICKDCFIDKKDLIQHKKERHSEKVEFHCNECGAGFATKNSLCVHLQGHDGKKSCPDCGQVFKTSAGLQKHRNDQARDKSHTCRLCKTKLTSAACLRYHMTSHRVHSCSTCQREFRSRAVLNQHMKIHCDEKPHQCEQCGMRFKVITYLRNHLRTHTTERKYTCQICKKSLKSRGCLYAHMRIHNDNKPHQCHVCQKRFMYPKRLEDHMRSHEGDGRPYSCNVCNRSFRSFYGVTRHEKKHAVGSTSLVCTECGRKFQNKGNLSQHMKSHVPAKDLVCDVCGKGFKYSHLLKRHKVVHNTLKNFACSFCDKKFKSEGRKNTHERLHKEVKKFKCGVCDQMFMYSSSLRLHTEKHARETLPCPVCGKRFELIRHLDRHVKEHTEERRHQCTECGRCFKQKHNLNAHLQLHQGYRPFSCHGCNKTFSRKRQVILHLKQHPELGPDAYTKAPSVLTQDSIVSGLP